jgi:purine catabolism regulator
MNSKTESQQLKEALAQIKQLKAEHESLEAAVNAHYLLTNLVLDGAGMELITAKFGELIQTSVELEDRYHNLRASYTYRNISDPYHRQRKTGSPAQPSEIEQALKPFSARLQATHRSLEVPAFPQLGLERSRLIAPVMVEGELLGYVVLLGKGTSFSPRVVYAIEHVVLIYAVLMMKEKSEAEAERRLRADFIEDLVSENSRLDEEMLRRRGPFFGFNPAAAYLYLVVDIDDFSNVIQLFRWDESFVRSFKREFYVELSRSIKNISRDSLLVSKSDSIIVLARLSETRETRVQIEQVLKAAQTCIARLTGDNSITMSIVNGGVCRKLSDFSQADKRARRCLELIKMLNRRGQVISYEELGFYTALFDHDNKDVLFEFATAQLQKLLDYDQEHGTALLDTLRTYLAQDKHLKKTAEACHIHLNALSYRLKRIQEVGKISLADPEICFNLQLALKIKDMEKVLK